MKPLVAAALAGILIALSSCSNFDGERLLFPNLNLPIDIGVQYQLEENLWIQVLPADKGGLEVKLVGEGMIGNHIKKIPLGYEIESPLTGLVYRVTQGASGRPLITIIGGTGSIQPVPIKDVEEEIPPVDGVPEPPEVQE